MWKETEKKLLLFIEDLNKKHPSIKLNFKYLKTEIEFLDTKGYVTCIVSPRGEFHPSLVKLIFLYTCSTEVKSRPYPYFTHVLKTVVKLTPGVIRHDSNV